MLVGKVKKSSKTKQTSTQKENDSSSRRLVSASENNQQKISKDIAKLVKRKLETHFQYEIKENNFTNRGHNKEREKLVLYNFPVSNNYFEKTTITPTKLQKRKKWQLSNAYVNCLSNTANKVLSTYPVREIEKMHNLPPAKPINDASVAAKTLQYNSQIHASPKHSKYSAAKKRNSQQETTLLSPRSIPYFHMHYGSILNTMKYFDTYQKLQSPRKDTSMAPKDDDSVRDLIVTMTGILDPEPTNRSDKEENTETETAVLKENVLSDISDQKSSSRKSSSSSSVSKLSSRSSVSSASSVSNNSKSKSSKLNTRSSTSSTKKFSKKTDLELYQSSAASVQSNPKEENTKHQNNSLSSVSNTSKSSKTVTVTSTSSKNTPSKKTVVDNKQEVNGFQKSSQEHQNNDSTLTTVSKTSKSSKTITGTLLKKTYSDDESSTASVESIPKDEKTEHQNNDSSTNVATKTQENQTSKPIETERRTASEIDQPMKTEATESTPEEPIKTEEVDKPKPSPDKNVSFKQAISINSSEDSFTEDDSESSTYSTTTSFSTASNSALTSSVSSITKPK